MKKNDTVRVLVGTNLGKVGTIIKIAVGDRPFGVGRLAGRDPAHVAWYSSEEIQTAEQPEGGALGPMEAIRPAPEMPEAL